MLKIFNCFFIFLLFISIQIFGQDKTDTLKLTIQQAEKIFLQNNLNLLSYQYNIDANKALVDQAKRWDNPTIITDQNIYDGKFFRHTKDYGQFFVQIQQLIKTAGKVKKQTQLAKDNVNIAQLQFEDVMRNLQYIIKSDFIETARLLKMKSVYETEILHVNKLVAGMDEVYKIGNISLKDNMRLKALLFGLNNELINIQTQLFPIQNELKQILQNNTTDFIYPNLNYQLANLIHATVPDIDSLVNIAISNRTDLKIAKSTLDNQNNNLVYQKALAKPDLTIGPEYDRLSSYTPNYVGLTVSLPLPIFNNNQDNIKAAKIQIKEQQANVDYQLYKIKNDISSSFQKVKYFQGINNPAQLKFSEDYEDLLKKVFDSYQTKQVSLLDLTDFIDSYKDNKLKLIDQHINLVKAMLELNFNTNSTVFNIQ